MPVIFIMQPVDFEVALILRWIFTARTLVSKQKIYE